MSLSSWIGRASRSTRSRTSSDALGGARLEVRELRVLVEVAPEGDEVGDDVEDFGGEDGHFEGRC